MQTGCLGLHGLHDIMLGRMHLSQSQSGSGKRKRTWTCFLWPGRRRQSSNGKRNPRIHELKMTTASIAKLGSHNQNFYKDEP